MTLCLSNFSDTYTIRELRTEIHELHATIAAFVAYFNEKINEMLGMVHFVTRDEARNRKNNVVFYGIPEDAEENYENMKRFLRYLITLGMQVEDFNENEIVFLRRLGPKNNPHKVRPLSVSFAREATRYKVLHASRCLMGSRYWVDRDYTGENYRKVKIIKGIHYRMRHDGIEVHRRGTQLIIQNVYYELEDIYNNPSLAQYLPVVQ